MVQAVVVVVFLSFSHFILAANLAILSAWFPYSPRVERAQLICSCQEAQKMVTAR